MEPYVLRFIRVLRLTVVVGLVAVASACTGSQSDAVQLHEQYESVARFGDLDRRAVLLAEQERIASCMATEGFAYIPYVPRDAESGPSDVGTLARSPEQEYAEREGYGFAAAVVLFATAEREDPNSGAVSRLTESEQEAYYGALYGVLDAGTSQPDGGCIQSSADDEYYSIVYEQFDMMSQAFERFAADPRYVVLEAQWSKCMAESGFEFSDRFDSIARHFEPQVSRLMVSLDETDLSALRAAEIEVALVDIECTQPIADQLEEIASEHEQRLLADASSLLAGIAELEARYGTR